MQFEWTENVLPLMPIMFRKASVVKAWCNYESDASSVAMIVRLSWQPEEPPDQTKREHGVDWMGPLRTLYEI